MQHDDERARHLQLRRRERKHAKIAGIVTEVRNLLQWTGRIRAAAEVGKAQTIHLRQASQEIDISGKRHGNSWQATFNVHPNQIVAALQNEKCVCCQLPEIHGETARINRNASTSCRCAAHPRQKCGADHY
ncbi:hypothetical protein ABIF50_002630 [Bradyrhizobium diazoefficiens]